MTKKITILILLLTVFSTSGCHALRKKFTRKPKHQEETPVYVDFKSYPTKPSKEAYNDYYVFVEGWLQELEETLKAGQSFKRAKRGINETIMNLEQMISFFSQNGKEKVYPIYQDLLVIRKEIETNPHPSDIKRNSLVSKLQHFKRKFEAEFKYSNAQQWMS
ncbi:MAG: hypothetical protein PHV55_00510 [Candidatus Omnitrophica bacterium]|nr:hypothetical protein [Candidatus Omnitrophota bacterium]